MALGAKRIETRNWPTKYRGWIGIHAAKAYPRECVEFAIRRPCVATLWAAGIRDSDIRDSDALPRGQLIAVVNLYACAPTESLARLLALAPDGFAELAFGNYAAGRYGFKTRSVRRLREPIPMKGMLGIWRLPRPITEVDLA